MQVKILEKTNNTLRFEIVGETHTLCNLLEKALLEEEGVELAGYNINHPLTSNPVVYIRMSGRRKPETALKETARKILQTNREFETTFNKALEDWEEKGKSHRAKA